MAKIVLGMAASHGPLLATPPEQWGGRVEADRRNPALVYRDGTFKFEELAKLRARENLRAADRASRQAEALRRLPARHGGDGAGVQGGEARRRRPGRQRPDGGVRGRQHPGFHGVLRRDASTTFRSPRSRRSDCRPASRSPSPTITARPRESYPGHPAARPLSHREAGAARFRRRGIGAAAAIGDLQYLGPAARLRLHLSPHHAGEFRPGGAVLHQHVLSAQPAERAALLLARRSACRRHRSPGTRICASPSSAPAACRISWWTRSSTAASSTP